MPKGASMVALAGMQVQFLSLLAKLSVPWPNTFLRFLNILEVLNLDPRDLFESQDWPVIDFRTLYIFVANFVPMILCILVLVLFQPVSTVVWFGFTGASIVMIIAGIVLHSVEGLAIGTWFAAAGGFLFAGCLVVGLIGYMYSHVDDTMNRMESNVGKEQQELKKNKLEFRTGRSIRLLAQAFGLTMLGLALLGLLFTWGMSSEEENTLATLGYVALALAFMCWVLFVLTLSLCGRTKIFAVQRFLHANSLMVLLVLLSVIFVPTFTYCINVFMCAEYECDEGSRFYPLADREEGSYSTSQDLFCTACVFLDDRCALNGTDPVLPNTLCPAMKTNRVWASPEVRCNDDATLYYKLSAILTIPVFLLLIPIMYVSLVTRITRIVDREVVLLPEDGEDLSEADPKELYKRRIYAVEPAAASLYQPFRYEMRNYAVGMLGFRLIIVAVTNVIAPFSTEASVFTLIIAHWCAGAALLIQEPFVSEMEHRLSVSLSGCNVMNSVYAALLHYEVGVPEWVSYILLALNILIPLLLTIASLRMVRNKSTQHKKGKRMLRRLRTAEKDRMKRRQELDSLLDERLLSDERDYEMETVLNSPTSGNGRILTIENAEDAREKERRLAAINARNETITAGINGKTARTMSKYFSVAFFVLLVALGMSVVGYLHHPTRTFYDGSSQLQRSTTFVFGGYPSFENFTDSCCCAVAQHPQQPFTLVERWVCNNGATVDHARVDVSGNTGIPLRPLCGRRFNYGCTVWVNNSQTSLHCSQLADPQLAGVSSKALDVLW